MYWVDEIVEEILKKHPDKEKYVCASGITPSGTVHVGNLRDVLTAELVKRGLIERGKKAELIWSWDDYDRFRKIPKNIDKKFEKYLGWPLSKIPDPYDKAKSYARHFELELEEVLPVLGIEARLIQQSKMFEKNVYWKLIKIALQKRREIAQIIFHYKAQETEEESLENYYPLKPYCEKCGRDHTKIIAYDNDVHITYECNCGYKKTLDISRDNSGKLSWRVDWPMRWSYEDVVFEPGGRDHSSAGGSYEVSAEIARKIFNQEPPIYQGYEDISIVGQTQKMSGSLGNVYSPKMLLEIYEPEIIRWFFARVYPLSRISFDLGDQILKNYAEWDAFLTKESQNQLNEIENRILYFSQVSAKKTPVAGSVSFRQLSAFSQITKGNVEELKRMIEAAGGKISEHDLKERYPRALNWTEKYAPKEYKIVLRNKPNQNFYLSLSSEQKDMIRELINNIGQHWSLKGLTNLIYDIPKKANLSGIEIKKRQRDFFKILYQLLIDAETGPRLPTFFLALGQDKLKNLLTFK